MSIHGEAIYGSQDRLEHLVDEAITFANTNGLLMFDRQGAPHHAPITLLPRAVPRSVYEKMYNAHIPLQKLYNRISHDTPFLLEHLEPIAKGDPFVEILINTLKLAKDRPSLGALVSRSDYMIDERPRSDTNSTTVYSPLQVEFNSISTGFCALSQRVASLHKYMLTSHLHDDERQVGFLPQNLPANTAGDGAATTAYHAHKYIQSIYPQFAKQFQVMMVVQPGESNAADQRHIEYSLHTNHQTNLIRATLGDIYTHMKYYKLTPSKQDDTGDAAQQPHYTLEQIEAFPLGNAQIQPHDLVLPFYKGIPISVFYYRSCYTPRDFTNQNDIDVYQSLELTSVIKCPTIGMHLAGTKKIQQLLCTREILQRYLDKDDEIDLVFSLFTNIYALDDNSDETLQRIDHAIAHPEQYVLKPMREGGGNNYYNHELREYLTTHRTNPDQRRVMILMQRIVPNVNIRQALVRLKQVSIVQSISEFGVFGGMVSVPRVSDAQVDENTDTAHAFDIANTIIHNTAFGCLVRTKADGVDEGGVAAGFSCIDSVLLED